MLIIYSYIIVLYLHFASPIFVNVESVHGASDGKRILP